jgi:hypothetical protein
MAKEIVSFLDHLEVFVLSDDEARWKAMRWIMLVCGVGGSIDLLQGSSVDEVVFLIGRSGADNDRRLDYLVLLHSAQSKYGDFEFPTQFRLGR